MNQIIPNFLQLITNLMMLLLFLRFFIQFADIRHHDPFAAPFYKVTGIVDLFSSIFPDLAKGRFSLSAVILIFLVYLVSTWAMFTLSGSAMAPLSLLMLGTFGFLLKFLSACWFLIIAMIIVSWIIMLTQNMHPLFGLIIQMSEPIIAPFKRITPDLGVLDLSPMVAMFALWMLEVIVQEMMKLALGMV